MPPILPWPIANISTAQLFLGRKRGGRDNTDCQATLESMLDSINNDFNRATPPTDCLTREAYIEWFHTIIPSATSRAFARGKLFGGRSSYELLLTDWPIDQPSYKVLDLGCGDGYLLKLARQRYGQVSSLSLFGLDLCEKELHRYSSEKQGALLLRGDSHCLPLTSNSFDLIVSHLAIMLFRDPLRALQEVKRILRLGGCFSAIVPGGGAPPSVLPEYSSLMRKALKAHPNRVVNLRNRETGTESQLLSLMQSAGFIDISIEHYVLTLDSSFEQVWGFLATTYDWPFLPIAERKQLHSACTALLKKWHGLTAKFRAAWVYITSLASDPMV